MHTMLPRPGPARNVLGVKLMRKQRISSQRPGNPAIERLTVSPLSGTADTGLTPSLGFPCILRSQWLLSELSFLTYPSLN